MELQQNYHPHLKRLFSTFFRNFIFDFRFLCRFNFCFSKLLFWYLFLNFCLHFYFYFSNILFCLLFLSFCILKLLDLVFVFLISVLHKFCFFYFFFLFLLYKNFVFSFLNSVFQKFWFCCLFLCFINFVLLSVF